MKGWILIAAAVPMLALVAPANAQMVKTHVTATNGVVIDKNADDFAGRAEYTAPIVKFSVTGSRGSGFVLAAKVRKAGTLGEMFLTGAVTYSGDWQYFETAVFKGGDSVDFKRTGGDVGSCRYGCTLTENFHISLSPADIQKHVDEDGLVWIQIRASKTGNTALFAIPTSYIAAINEVAK